MLTILQAEYAVVDEGIHSLAEQMGVRSRDSQSPGARPDKDFDIQSASEWPEVESSRVLLSPIQCRQLWRQFTSDSAFIVQQAQATQVPSGSLMLCVRLPFSEEDFTLCRLSFQCGTSRSHQNEVDLHAISSSIVDLHAIIIFHSYKSVELPSLDKVSTLSFISSNNLQAHEQDILTYSCRRQIELPAIGCHRCGRWLPLESWA